MSQSSRAGVIAWRIRTAWRGESTNRGAHRPAQAPTLARRITAHDRGALPCARETTTSPRSRLGGHRRMGRALDTWGAEAAE